MAEVEYKERFTVKGQMLRRMIAMGLTLCIVIGILPDGYAMDDTKGSVALYSDETITYVPFRMIDSSVDFEEFCDFLQSLCTLT